MTVALRRAYTIDANPPNVCHPIIFTDLMNLPAAYGTVIVVDDMEHMRVPEGWIDAMGNWCTNEEMREPSPKTRTRPEWYTTPTGHPTNQKATQNNESRQLPERNQRGKETSHRTTQRP